jgi:hypothetical protein
MPSQIKQIEEHIAVAEAAGGGWTAGSSGETSRSTG